MRDLDPKKENIDQLFSDKQYYIDYYQREYTWRDEPVKRLLDDVFYKFNVEYEKHKDSELLLPDGIDNYSWYYLNTCVINRDVDGKLYVVDGQQRLTTFTLILMKLKHLSIEFELAHEFTEWIDSKVHGPTGFWMNHEEHKDAMDGLYNNARLDQINKNSGDTAKNMVNNYRIISSRLDKEFKSQPLRKFEHFVYYFMYRLMMINIDVGQADCPMIFEAINDRGVKPKPHEILKGKLLGQVNKEDLVRLNLNQLWNDQVDGINKFSTDTDEIDDFFIYFFRARLADGVSSGKQCNEQNYHRIIFSKSKLDLDRNSSKTVEFLQNDFKYYTDLYKKVLDYYSVKSLSETEGGFTHVYYNKLTEMKSMLFRLILSSCSLNDPQEPDKISKIAYEVDRLYCLLQLQGFENTREFDGGVAIYKLISSIRDKDISSSIIRDAFDKALTDLLSKKIGRSIKTPFSDSFFKKMVYNDGNKKFIRYFFARIEKFIADSIGRDMDGDFLNKLVNSATYRRIEHILGDNKKCRSLFGDEFDTERNRLGGLLLLGRIDGFSSDEATYREKLSAYAKSTLLWNKTLCNKDCYRQNDNFDGLKSLKIDVESMTTKFGPDELKKRHDLLYKMVKLIWK